MVMGIQQPIYIVKGQGADMNMNYGNKEDIVASYLIYIREHYNSNVESFEEAVEYVKQNPNDLHPVKIFGMKM